MRSDSAGRAVVRLNPGLLVVGGPLVGVIMVGLWWAVIASILSRDWTWPFQGDGFSTPGFVIGWLVIITFLLLTTLTVWYLLVFREVFLPDAVKIRAVGPGVTVPLGEVTAIRTVRAQLHTGRQVIGFPRLAVEARHRGRRVRAVIDPGMSGAERAYQVLDGWVRARPELLADDLTREFFGSRGASS